MTKPFGLLFMLVLLAVLGGCASDRPQQPPLLPPIPTLTPGPAPLVPLQSLDGEEFTLQQWRGKGVVLNFWATWCIPCKTEMPALAAIHEARDEIVVVGVNYRENEDAARDFVEELSLPFPILLDPGGELARSFQVVGLPTTFFIDAEGQIVNTRIGPLDEASLEQLIEPLTTGQVPSD